MVLSVGTKIRVSGHDHEFLSGFEALRQDCLERLVTIRPIVDGTSDFTAQFGGDDYYADQDTLPELSAFCPAWHLYASLSTFPGSLMTQMQTGQSKRGYFLKERVGIIGQTLRMRGCQRYVGQVSAIGCPISIRDWSNQTLPVTEAIELTPVAGSEGLVGKVGGVFETVDGYPIGSLISQSENNWFLAPIVPYLIWSEQKYRDPLKTSKDGLTSRLKAARVVDLEAA